MRVLIATDHLQGSASTDHHDAVDGEIVMPVVVECGVPACDRCLRGWIGLVSHGATTTAMVVDRPGVTPVDLRRRVHDWLDRAGVVDTVVQAVEAGAYEVAGQPVDDPVVAVAELVEVHVAEIREVCDAFAVGTTVSRLGGLVAARRIDDAA